MEDLDLEIDKTGSLYLPLTIAGISVLGLLDTGSTISVVHPSLLMQISRNVNVPLKKKATCTKIRLADGSVVSSEGLVELELGLGASNEVRTQEVVIAEIKSPVILGIDFLRAHKGFLDMRGGTLKVDGTVHIFRRMDGMHRICRVSVAETVIVPTMSEMLIPGNIDGAPHCTHGIVEMSDHTLCDGNLMMARTVVNPTLEVLPLRVMNLSTEPQTLWKDTHIGTCEPVSVAATLSPEGRSHIASKLPDHVRQMSDECRDVLAPNEQELAECMLAEFVDDFSRSKDDLTVTDADQHDMTMISNERVKLGPHRLPLAKRQALKCELERLLKLGIIEPSKSSWASPVVLVTKKDGSLRLCVDYRRVNDHTLKDSYPLPRIDDSIDALRGSKWFSTLDLASGYWQVPMNPKDIDKTAFMTPFGLFQFKVMPFGMANAPATFERMIERVLAGLHWEICLIYLDYVIVFGRTFDAHMVPLHQVLSRIKQAKLKLSPTKCKLFRHEVEYLGHVVSSEGVSTDPRKIQAITDWPTPRTAKEVQSFVGLCSYYRRFVKGFANVARPLHQIVNADEFRWTAEYEAAFSELKQALTTPPVLGYPADEGIFILDTDASGQGIGAVLSQIQDDQERVIAYFSLAMIKPEQHYCVTRRELLAVLESVKHFHHYLYGRHFMIRTDHGSLRWLMRWLQVLSQYDFEIEHRPGTAHKNADGLSRRPCADCRFCERQESKESSVDPSCPGHRICALDLDSSGGTNDWCEPWSAEELRAWQAEDEIMSKVLTWVEVGKKPPRREVRMEAAVTRTFWSVFEQLTVIDGILNRKPDTNSKFSAPRLIAPRNVRDEIFTFLHTNRTGGHLGIKHTNSSARRRFWWPGMKADVVRWCQHCNLCQHRNLRPGPKRASLFQDRVGAPMERVAFDILSFPDETTEGNSCILVICDYFTKWVEAFDLPDHKAATVAGVLVTEIFLWFGVPRYLHSDQAPEFMSELMSELCTLLEIQRTRTTPYRPQSDELVERFNKTLIDMLAKFCNERHDDWDQHLPYLMCAYHATVNESTKCSPNLLMLGRVTNLPIDLMYTPERYESYRCHIEYVEWVRVVDAVCLYSCRLDCCGRQNLLDILVHSHFTSSTLQRNTPQFWRRGLKLVADRHLKYSVVVWQHQKTSFYVHTTSVTDSGAQVLALSLIGRG